MKREPRPKKHANTEMARHSALNLKSGGVLDVNSHQLQTFDIHKDGAESFSCPCTWIPYKFKGQTLHAPLMLTFNGIYYEFA